MRNIMLLLLALISFQGHTQTTAFGSFKTEDQEIKYQKVFTEDSITVARLEEYYKTLPYVSNLTASSEGVQFDVNDIIVDFKKFQFRQIDVPTLIQTGKYSGKVSIGVRDGKYRITMQSIMVTGDAGYKKITSKENLTNFAAKNSGTVLNPDWCKPNTLGLLEMSFTDKLQFVGKKKGDW